MRILKPINETFNNEIQAQEDNLNDAINDLSYIQFKDPFIEQICHEKLHVYTYADAKKITKIDGTIFNNAITDFESFDELRYFTNLKEIGNATFISCGEFLQQISLPNSITKIGHQAFQYTLLEEITIPNKITKLEFNTFYECRRLKKVILPKNLKIIENAVFSYCVSLQEIHIPDTVTEIGSLAFYDCESLQQITIPDNIRYIGNDVFKRCENLKTIYVSRKNYEKFKNWDFGKLLKIKNNSNLVNETFNNEIQAQEDNIDDAIDDLGLIQFEDPEVERICHEKLHVYTYADAKKISELEYDIFRKSSIKYFNELKYFTNLQKIGVKAFAGCKTLQEITLPNNVTGIGNAAFFNCESLQQINIPDNVTIIKTNTFNYCKSLQQIYIPDNVTEIGFRAFCNCNSLQQINIPNGITKIKDYTFCNCKSLQQINIPNGVTEIGSGAFSGCNSLQQINIPNSVTKIGNAAFFNCESLQQINIPNGVTEIGNTAFGACNSLQQINIPNSVTGIGNTAFGACNSLQQINIPDNIENIESSIFFKCKNLKAIYVSKKNYEKYKYKDFSKLLKIKDSSNLINETFNNDIQAQEDNIDDAIQELNFISYKDDEYLKFFKNVQEIINKQLVKKYLLNKKQVRFKLFGDNLQRILRIDFYTHSINTISDTMIADSYELTYQLRLDNIIKDTFSVHEYYPNINEVYLYSQDLSKYKGVSTNKLIYKNINGIYYYMNNVNAEKVAEYFIDKIKDIMNLTETFNNEIQGQEHNNIDSTIFEVGNKDLVDFIKNNQKYLLGMFLDYDDYYYVNTDPKRCLEIQNKDLKYISRGLEYLKPFENPSKEDTLNTQWLRGMLFRGLDKACSSIDHLDILDIHITRHNIKDIDLEEIKKYLYYSPDSPKNEYFLDTPLSYSILQEKLKTLKLWFLACRYIINLRKEYDEKIKTIHNKLNSQYQNHIINGDVVSQYLTETFNNNIQSQEDNINDIIKELNKNQYLQKYGLPIWQGIDYRCDNVYKGYQAIEEYIRDTEESIKSEIQYAIRFNHDPKSIKNKNILASIYNHGINYFYKGEDLDLNYEDSCNVWKLTKYLVRLYKDLQNELDNIKNNYVHNIQNGLIDDMKAFKEVFNTSNILDETFNNEIQAQEDNINNAINDLSYIQFEDPIVEKICHEQLHVYTYEDAKKIIELNARSGFYNSEIKSFNELKYFINLKKIEKYTFYFCKSLQQINIPNSVTKIGVKAFAGCKTLQEITLPNNVTEIQFMTFAWCSSLQQINIPNNLNIIEDNTFEACFNLKNINIPSTVTKIGRAAFIYCQSLQNINIPNGITEILRSTFEGCKSLQNIIIPKKVTFIDSKAFANCKALQQINIPDGVTHIEAGLGENGDIIYNAFENCSNLKTIYVSKLNYERLRNCSKKLLLRLEKVLKIEPKIQWINLLQIKDNLLTETFNNEIQAKKDNIEDTLNNKLSFVVSRDKFIEILEKDLHNFTKIDENTRFKNDTDWIGKYIEGGLSRSMNFYLGKFINHDESDTTIMETSKPSIFLEFLQENPKNANDNDPYLYAQVGLSVSFQPIAAMYISKLLNSTSIKPIYQQVFKYSNETIIGKTKVFKLTIGTAKDIANLINTINTDNFRREYMKMLPSKPGDLKKLFINYYKKYIPLSQPPTS